MRNDKVSFVGLLTYCKDVRTNLCNATPDSCVFRDYYALSPLM